MDENEAIDIMQKGFDHMNTTGQGVSLQGQIRRPTRLERLRAEKVMIEKRLVLIDDAIRLLETNPMVSSILEALDKVI